MNTHPEHATVTEPTRLTPELRTTLKKLISDRVRERTRPRPGTACPECGADSTDLPAPVLGCHTCANRFWRRRQRAAA